VLDNSLSGIVRSDDQVQIFFCAGTGERRRRQRAEVDRLCSAHGMIGSTLLTVAMVPSLFVVLQQIEARSPDALRHRRLRLNNEVRLNFIVGSGSNVLRAKVGFGAVDILVILVACCWRSSSPAGRPQNHILRRAVPGHVKHARDLQGHRRALRTRGAGRSRERGKSPQGIQRRLRQTLEEGLDRSVSCATLDGWRCDRRGMLAEGACAGIRRKAPAEGKIRVDLSLTELLQLSWLAQLGFQHMMPNYRGFEIHRFSGEEDAWEGRRPSARSRALFRRRNGRSPNFRSSSRSGKS